MATIEGLLSMMIIIEEFGVYGRAAGIALPGIDTSAKGGQYQQPFYRRQTIKGKWNVQKISQSLLVFLLC